MIDYELMPHQKEAVAKSIVMRDLFLAFEVGTGKTPATINILRQKYAARGELVNTLILCPLIVTHNWKKEFLKFSNLNAKCIEVLDGPIKNRIKKIKSLHGPRVLITNYDSFSNQDLVRSIIEWCPRILVCDESHQLKNPKSIRAKNVLKIADKCEHRYMLTGTPILNNAMDLFMQYRIMDGGETFGHNFFAFRHLFFEDANAQWQGKKGYFPNWQARPKSHMKLNELINKKTLRVLKSDVLKDLPPLVREEVLVELSAEQKRLYNQMKRDFVAFVEAKLKTEPRASVARLALTKSLRMQEIISGFITLEDGTRYRIRENPRLDKLRELLVDLTPRHKVIVWANFRENYAQIRELCEAIGVGYREIHGDITAKEKFKSQDDFNNLDEVRVLCGNPQAGGVGINLIASDYSIYFTRDFKLSSDLQSEARNHRKGSEIHDKITRVDIIAPNTIDELILKALLEKGSISEAIIDNLHI